MTTTSTDIDSDTGIAFARSREEADQPSLSARAIEPLTRAVLAEAGVSAGMRVLDVCTGAGDLAFLVGEIVGPEGRVTGVDETSQALACARERAEFRDLENIEFIEASLDDPPSGEDFDAIVGRAVLMYRRDPAADLRKLVRCLRPGGVVVFQELDLPPAKTTPPAPVVDKVSQWVLDTFRRAGIETEMGPKLYTTFVAAGLPPPRMHLDGFIGGPESVSPALLANIARVLAPQIEALGVATADEMQIDTLEERIRGDLAQSGGVMSTPLLIGAWTKLPD